MDTFDEALLAHLARYDRLQAELRKMLADPDSVSESTPQCQSLMNDLVVTIKSVFKLKNAREDARWTLRMEERLTKESASSSGSGS